MAVRSQTGAEVRPRYPVKSRYVMVGNHRDAWGFGALDPGSGTAQMMEVRLRDVRSKRQVAES